MNKLVTALGLAFSLSLACTGSDLPLSTESGSGGSGGAGGMSGVGGAATNPGGAGGNSLASACRLAPPCPSDWYEYSDTICTSPGLYAGPRCSPNGDGLCYQPCKSSTDCTDPTFPNCTTIWVFHSSDAGSPTNVCTSAAPVPACASNLGGAGGRGGDPVASGGAGGQGGDPVASGGTGGATYPPGSGPASAELLATTPAPWGVAVDATTVYVAAQMSGPLIAVPVAGGAPARLATASVFTVAIDETSVYWSDGRSIYSCTKQGCAASTVALASTGLTHGIAVDAANVYWASTSAGKVTKVGKKGGASVVLASGGYPYQLAVDDANVYWTDESLHAVMKVPAAGGTPVELAASVSPMGIAVDGSNVYYTTADGKMMQISKGGGAALLLSAELGNEPWGIATDGKNVYGASMEHGTIVKVPVGGGAATVLAWGQGSPAGVAVDDAYVYWTAVETGEVMRVAK